jgi:hypothetical protein
MNTIATRRLTAATMASAAILAGAGFTALGSIFNYPKILQSPAAGILAAYRQHSFAISAWFLVLVLSAALLSPAVAGVNLGWNGSQLDVLVSSGTTVFAFNATTGAPIDPSDVPYELIKNGCDVGLSVNTKVPLK